MQKYRILRSDEDALAVISETDALSIDGDTREYIKDLLFGYLGEASDGECEVAAALTCGCLSIRIYDGEYLFICPIPLSEGADISGAAESIRKYAIREQIPITFIDAGADEALQIAENFRFYDVGEMDEDGEVLFVRPKSEIADLDMISPISDGDVSLTEIRPDDMFDYAALCMDTEVNRLYGYDYREDYEDPDDEMFYNIMAAERECGLALCLAVRYRGEFVGEVSIFDFDYLGGAKIAIRMFSEFWGRGIGSRTLKLALEFAEKIDIKMLKTSIKKENTASIKMTEKYMKCIGEEKDELVYEKIF